MKKTVVVNGTSFEVPTNLQRLDSGRRGWNIRVSRKGQKHITKYFADSKHGGTQKAFDAAVKHLESLYESGEVLRPEVARHAAYTRHVRAQVLPHKDGFLYLRFQCTATLENNVKWHITQYAGTEKTINVESAKRAYKRVNALQEHQKAMTLKNEKSEKFEYDEELIKKLIRKYKCDTSHITLQYLDDVFKEYKQAQCN